MLAHFIRSIVVLVLAQAVFGGIALAQAPPQQSPCSLAPQGMTQKQVKSFRKSDRKPITISLCDGSTYEGSISEMEADTFTLKTTRNQVVQISYANVKEITFLPSPSSQSLGETAVLIPIAILIAPLLILAMIMGWDGC
ncbi:MAG TPA: hypothetical protein VLV89_11050 [Candidatus Acidoferrum sp.]|nr:hypothetical protein [Candidatus Acidoferrum sp.]